MVDTPGRSGKLASAARSSCGDLRRLARQEDAAVGDVQPGEHDELVAGLDAVKAVGNGGIELEPRLRCAFERLIGSVGGAAKR